MSETDVPTPVAMWDFLLGLKETTEAGFKRLGLEMAEGFARVQTDLSRMQADLTSMQSDLHLVERRLLRVDDRLAAIESLNVRLRLDDHERRISRIEQRFPGRDRPES